MINWWNQTVFYQIYMPSFKDGNNDGIGDFEGITEKLPHLKELGIKGIWLTPFYKSPKVDNGYDISDYFSVDSSYGNMEDFDRFLKVAHDLGIRIIVDMVINHTSSEHEWFKESRSSVDNAKRDWFIWKKPVDGKEPNNWESFFGEKAWEYDELTGEYYYHSFAKEQVDLNWANNELREAIYAMLDFWIEKGIDGFRLDVINNLTLDRELKDNPFDKEGKQIHQYDVNQDGIHDVFKELREKVTAKKEIFLVGEISSDNLELIHSYVGDEKLHTTFNFNLGSKDTFHINDFYEEIKRMNDLYKNHQPTLFFGSHDMGRFPSRFEFKEEQIKLLTTFMMTFRGIPFLYFGDEIGMESLVVEDVKEANDIQGVIAYKKAIEEGKTVEEALTILNKEGRDKSRNVMQWDDTLYGGFSEHKPWIYSSGSNKDKNVAAQMKDQHSIYHFNKKLLEVRNSQPVLQDGDCRLYPLNAGVIRYERWIKDEKITVLLNFGEKEFTLEELDLKDSSVVLTTFKTLNEGKLRAFEGVILK